MFSAGAKLVLNGMVGLFLAGPLLARETIGLREAEQIAEQNSVDLRVSRLEAAAAKESADGRFRDLFPSLNFSYRRNRTVARRNIDNGTHSVQASISQPIWDGGRGHLAYEVATIDVRLAREQMRQLKNELRLQVRQAYLGLIQSHEGVSLARASFESSERVLERGIVQRRQGVITELDYLEIQNENRRRRLDLDEQEKAYADELVDFARMLRLPADEVPDIRPLNLYDFSVEDIQLSDDEMYRLAMQNRSDVRQARIDLMRSRREYLITKYDWMPTVSLTGSYGRSGEEWPPRNTEWSVGLNFTFRVFGNTITNDVQRTDSNNETSRGYSASGQVNVYDNAAWREPHMRNQIELLRSRTQSADLEQSIRDEMARVRRSYLHRKKQLDVADRSLAIQEQRFAIERLKFRRGQVSVTDFFEEELEIIQARLDLIRQRIEFVLSVNQIELDIGVPLDYLELVDIQEIGEAEAEARRRLWEPQTSLDLNIEPVHLNLSEDGERVE